VPLAQPRQLHVGRGQVAPLGLAGLGRVARRALLRVLETGVVGADPHPSRLRKRRIGRGRGGEGGGEAQDGEHAGILRAGRSLPEPARAGQLTRRQARSSAELRAHIRQACIVQPSTPIAAWRRASERVGCGWQVRATSSLAALNSIATQYSAIISPTCGPIMWAPRISSVLASASTFTKPSVSWLTLARLLAANGNLRTLDWRPSAFSP